MNKSECYADFRFSHIYYLYTLKCRIRYLSSHGVLSEYFFRYPNTNLTQNICRLEKITL